MKTNINCKLSLIFGLFFFVPLFNFILGFIAILLGYRGLKETKVKGKGKLLAVMGIILGFLPYILILAYGLRLLFGENISNLSLLEMIVLIITPFVSYVAIFTFLRIKKVI